MVGKRTNVNKGTWVMAARGATDSANILRGRGSIANARETEVHPYHDAVVLDLGTSEA
jgi:hypothetical protein